MSFKLVHQILHIFIVETAVGIHDINDINDTFLNHFKSFQQLVVHNVRQCHNVQRSFVTPIMKKLHQLQSFVYILHIAGYTN
ncbi:hypothetical protein D3C76_1672870 [compost metagenome]